MCVQARPSELIFDLNSKRSPTQNKRFRSKDWISMHCFFYCFCCIRTITTTMRMHSAIWIQFGEHCAIIHCNGIWPFVHLGTLHGLGTIRTKPWIFCLSDNSNYIRQMLRSTWIDIEFTPFYSIQIHPNKQFFSTCLLVEIKMKFFLINLGQILELFAC